MRIWDELHASAGLKRQGQDFRLAWQYVRNSMRAADSL